MMTATAPSTTTPATIQKTVFTDALKVYLSEINGLKDKVQELEKSKSQLERRLLQSGPNSMMASTLAHSSAAGLANGNNHRRGDSGRRISGSWGGLMMAGEEVLRLLEEEANALGGQLEREKAGATAAFLDSSASVAAGRDDVDDDGALSANNGIAMTSAMMNAATSVMSEEEAGAFYRSHQEMSLSVADLSRDIELKEKLVKQLKESVKRYEVMKKFYEEKLKQMDEETAR